MNYELIFLNLHRKPNFIKGAYICNNNNCNNFQQFKQKHLKLQYLFNKPPVALAILFRSTFFTLRTAIAPPSTKYFMHKSSIPPDSKITLAPLDKIF